MPGRHNATVLSEEASQMGYHVTILRTGAGIRQAITEDEVRRAIVPMAGRFGIFPGTEEFWLYQPALGDASEILVLSDGELWTKSPGEPFVELMIELAGYLGARVRGDELETYRSLEEVYIHPDDQAEWDLAHPPEPRTRSLSRVVRERAWRFVVVLLVGAVLLYRHLTSS
jgi:hypothetical protein